MLYKKNNTEKLSNELFENPTSEYRGAPFWAWNCDLTQEMLIKQIGYLKEMGFGGFHMHCRAGLSTEYLGTEFMNLIKCCRDKAEAENMYAYLYDEDRWPSGSAGGIVTKNKKFRQKFLVMTEKKDNNAVSPKEGYENGLSYLIACFDVILNPNGTLKEYKMIDEDSGADGIKKYFYVRTPAESGWFNGQTYVDTLSDEAMNEFIKVTYEAYKRAVGESFGKSIPSIFTDEPQFAQKQTLKFAENPDDVRLPWTTDFPLTYKNAYGEDIVSKLPELFWDLDNTVSSARYHFHDHICERFTNAFADKCGKWCDEHGLYLTGHMVEEDNLTSQTRSIGEDMRAYRAFRIPGIDMLCDDLQFTTAKQAQSAAHQYGREGVMSELYGVTNWDFDFRGHKFQGDWQAALGVTLRVPHLSWVSMKGSAKRDYPASINYQSPWYKEYGYIEDHFARLNTALTRGKPEVKIGVIHPIESFWLHWGPSNTGSDIRREMEDNFANITKFLINGFADFDFISESLLPTQVKEVSDLFPAGGESRFFGNIPLSPPTRIQSCIIIGNFFKIFYLCSAVFCRISTAERITVSIRLVKLSISVCPVAVYIFAACCFSVCVIFIKSNTTFLGVFRHRDNSHCYRITEKFIFVNIPYHLNIISVLSYTAENNVINAINRILVILLRFKIIEV